MSEGDFIAIRFKGSPRQEVYEYSITTPDRQRYTFFKRTKNKTVFLNKISSFVIATYSVGQSMWVIRYFICGSNIVETPLTSVGNNTSNGAKIRNRYNQVPHLTQDTNGKVTNSQKTPQTRAKRSALSQQVTTKHI